MHRSATKTLSLWGAITVLSACRGGDSGGTVGGTDGGSGDGAGSGIDGDGSGESGEEPQPPDEPPDPNGDQCGNTVSGWQTECKVDSFVATASDKGSIPGVTPVGERTGRFLCCEGNPPVTTADHGCSDICLLELCEAAKRDHMSRCSSCGPLDCGFDMSKCLAGGADTQWVTCPFEIPFSYTLTADCAAFDNEVRNPDGSFGFLQEPVNDISDDPPLCMPSSELGLDPPAGLGQYVASASTGTVARVSWSLAGADGKEQSEDLDVHFEYALVPCSQPSADCVEIASLVLTLPTTEALGMTITKARLEVISVAQAPVLEGGRSFDFDEGAIGVLMQATVDGIPLVLSGPNVGTPHGVLSPAGNRFSISDLRFEFEDSVIAAALEIEIQGQYDARRPNAQITRLGAPSSCQEPISLFATSWDDDDEPLTHSWWVRDIGTFSGPLLELTLGPGDYEVMLTSSDPSGLFDTDLLRYAHDCQ